MSYVVLGIYIVAMAFVFLYSLVQLSLVIHYFRKKPSTSIPAVEVWPSVTIQLPTFNELYVAERLIENIAKIDYPDDKLEIQVLDDSTDETTEIIQKTIAKVNFSRPQLAIHLIRRPDRTGYKAGALKYGLELARGEYIAIFDADFMPGESFLKQTIPHFVHEKIGVVQTRWGHLNKNYSFLTRLQAFGLDAHFTVEQVGRNSGNHFINFNGTGGVWRKACILDAGNWQADTLTEDLDLSYRAQLKHWKFNYLENVEAPAELPATMNALKSQQFRWTKGAAENAMKNLARVFRSDQKAGTKIHSFFHLMNSSVFLCIIVMALFSLPVLYFQSTNAYGQELHHFAPFLAVSLVALGTFYFASYWRINQHSIKTLVGFIVEYPLFLSVSMGLSLHNCLAVLEGYSGKKTAFIRTPKFNLKDKKDSWKQSLYRAKKVNTLTLMEGLFALYFLAGFILGIYWMQYGFLVFHAMLFIGYSIVFLFSYKHAKFS